MAIGSWGRSRSSSWRTIQAHRRKGCGPGVDQPAMNEVNGAGIASRGLMLGACSSDRVHRGITANCTAIRLTIAAPGRH